MCCIATCEYELLPGGKMSNHSPVNGYDLYNGKTIQEMLPVELEDDLSSPPGGPSCAPPGSPQQAKKLEMLQQELLRSRQEAYQQKKANELLKTKLQLYSTSESKFDNDFLKDTQNDENIKDSEIRHLKRQLTILQAELYKKEKEHTHRLRLQNDEINSLTEQLHTAMKQLTEANMKLESQENDPSLLEERNALKEENAQLRRRLGSLSPPMSGSLQSLSPNSSYCQELDYLHKMVDTLKATVLEQRNVFSKMGLASRAFSSLQSQSQSGQGIKLASAMAAPAQSSSAVLSAPPNTGVGPATSTQSWTSRQAEESLERVPSPSKIVLASESSSANPTSTTELPKNNGHPYTLERFRREGSPVKEGVTVGGVNGHNSPRMNKAPDFITDLTVSLKGMGLSNADVMPIKSGSPNLSNGVYVNMMKSDAPVNPRYKEYGETLRNIGEQFQHSNGHPGPQVPIRQGSHSEVINRRSDASEGPSVPARSQSEYLGKSPNLALQQQKNESNLPQQLWNGGGSAFRCQPTIVQQWPDQTQGLPPSSVAVPPAVHPSSAAGFTQQPLRRPETAMGSRTLSSSSRTPSNGHQPVLPPPTAGFQPEAAVFEPAGAVYGLPNHPRHNTASTNEVTASSTSQRPGRGSGDHLCCPVCNQSFGDDQMEAFQAHVFDCFDSENGPETLQAVNLEDSPVPPILSVSFRTCPMCQQKFEMGSMSQSEFEQHVHRHFGEEAFEVLG